MNEIKKWINKVIILDYFIATCCKNNLTSYFNALQDVFVVMSGKNYLYWKNSGLFRK